VVVAWDAMNLFFQKNKQNSNIVFIIDSLVVGGAELQLVMLAGELWKRGYLCKVFALRADGALVGKLESLGVVVINGGLSEGRNRFALLRGVLRLWRCIYENRPCVVHTYLPLSNFIGSLVAKLAGASMVVTSRRGMGTHQDVEPRWRYFDRISNALSDLISVNSRAVEIDTLRRDGVNRNKLVCIYNGLDISRFNLTADLRNVVRIKLGLSQTEFAWVMVGNFASYKGHQDLLLAFAQISNKYQSRLFLVGGDRGAQSCLVRTVANLGIASQVVFLGDRNDVAEILCAMDGYVMASHSEGFSNAILEAMASALPIVATNVGGNAEALQDGKLGILVPPHDPSGLQNAMQEIMNDQELRRKLGLAAQKAAFEGYDIHAMVNSYLKMYNLKVTR
jgi:glycosyltransferase involved in cell wall biosynthesis